MSNIDNLIEGYHRFREGDWAEERARWEELSRGQSPKVMIIACSDSRVDPATVFDVVPGQTFIVRNVANLVPPFEPDAGRHGVSAALEFAVTQLEVESVVVMGHASCGGIKASLSGAFAHAEPGEGGFVASWVSLLDEAREKVAAAHGTESDEAIRALELEGIKTSLANLRTFPWVKEREAAGTLKLYGAYFAIADGRLHVLDQTSGDFAQVD